MTIAHSVIGSGPPVLLVHEGVADQRMWRHTIPVLEPDHTVVAVDLRGFGESPNTRGPFSHVEDVREELDERGIEQATVVGGSLGGRVALELTLVHPDRVERLVLCPPALRDWEWSQTVRDAWAAEEAAYEAGDLDRATEINVELWCDGPNRGPDAVDPAVRDLVRAMQRHAFELPWPDPPPEEAALYPPASTRLGEIRVPTLVIVGDEDVEDFQRIAETVADGIPSARRVVIEDAAHVVALERPDEFNRALLEFLPTYTSNQ
ncbi:MAG TPA: alpha/beta hydrolase [Gaiellaceae bacterium]